MTSEAWIGLVGVAITVLTAIVTIQNHLIKFQERHYDQLLAVQKDAFTAIGSMQQQISKNTHDVNQSRAIIQREVFERYYEEGKEINLAVDNLTQTITSLRIKIDYINNYLDKKNEDYSYSKADSL